VIRGLGVGGRIRARRMEQGIPQEQLAKKAGVSTTWLSRLENDLVKPKLDDVAKVARALGVPVKALFNDVDDGNTAEIAESLDDLREFQEDLAVLASNWEWSDDDQKEIVRSLMGTITRVMRRNGQSREPHDPRSESVTTPEDGLSRTIAKYRDYSDVAQRLLKTS
jgi:transcriptional regulator with XRE-family HTH domain